MLAEESAKNAKRDQTADALWGQANKLMDTMKAPPKPNEEFRKKLKQLGSAATKMLDQISALSAASKSSDFFLRRLSGATLAGIASTADTVADIAMRLA